MESRHGLPAGGPTGIYLSLAAAHAIDSRHSMNSLAPIPTTTTGELSLEPVLPPGEFLPGLALALAIGLLIGIERGWRLRGEEAGSRVAGIRTFAMIGLLGGLTGLELSGALRLVAPLLAAAALAALLLGYAREMRRGNNVSATSAVAAIMTLGLGAIASSGHMALASVGAGATVILLASRHALHRAIRFASESDIKALLRLVLVVFVILPLLPDAGMGPYLALNPRRLWMVVVITGSISFIGYALARWLGPRRGTLITAAVGALISSTAVTLDSARRIKEDGPSAAADAAVALASLEMIARALLLVGILAAFALDRIAALVAPGFAVAAASAAILLYRARNAEEQVNGRDARPPGLGLALLFAVSVAAISLLSAWAESRFGGGRGAAVIALGGVVDIDAAIAAVGALAPGTLPAGSVALAIAAPVLFNTAFKLVILIVVGGWRGTVWGAASLGLTALALAVPIALAVGSLA